MRYQLPVIQPNTCSRHVNRHPISEYLLKKEPSEKFSIYSRRNLQDLYSINLSNLWG